MRYQRHVKAVAEVKAEVDKLLEKVVALEATVNGGNYC
ncbi:hypothetical protein CK203_094037 [Vitis vinifera]|uniref:Uncharacterized protein n=1 Tax=Vitis vinifera TaxID=29760 RepID=A0A438BRX4_VITVI|nr:hypothetical protein CK203_094037 [Vitis vinifera]